MTAQLTLFDDGVSARSATVWDLEGLLAGPGQVVRRGTQARLGTVLPWPEPWRVDALLVEAATGLQIDLDVTESGTGGTFVRTGFTPELLPLAQLWTRGAVKYPPDTLQLDGPRLRWWLLAAGRVSPGPPAAVLLTLDPQPATWGPVLSGLAGCGLTATLVHGRRNGLPAARVCGRRRLRRLAEMVGDHPRDGRRGSG